jgi:hypothetical protein
LQHLSFSTQEINGFQQVTFLLFKMTDHAFVESKRRMLWRKSMQLTLLRTVLPQVSAQLNEFVV